MVHLSTHSGLASSSSISLARLSGDESAVKLRTRPGVGMRPVRSSVTRRMNSKSLVLSAGEHEQRRIRDGIGPGEVFGREAGWSHETGIFIEYHPGQTKLGSWPRSRTELHD